MSKAWHTITGFGRSWYRELLACVGGLLMPLGFAPFEWRLLPFVSLLFLLLALKNCSRRRAVLVGFLFGLGMFGLGVSWVYNSLHDFGEASALVSAGIALGLVLINALYIAAVAYLYRRLPAPNELSRVLIVFPVLWVLVEWLRSWLFTGFPWLLLAYSQVDTPLAVYAPVGGALLVSTMTVLWAAAIYLLLTQWQSSRWPVLGVLAGSIMATAVLAQFSWFTLLQDRVEVALVQADIPQQIKMQASKRHVSLDGYRQLSEPYFDKADLIVWPETAIPAFQHRVRPYLDNLQRALKQTDLFTGIFVYDAERQRYYNSMYKVGDDQAVYHKRHLVPFGEYMPFRGLLAFLNNYINIPMSDIAPGSTFAPISLAGHPVGVSICYESAYSNVFRQQPQAAFLVNTSNDAWFGDSFAPHQHLEIARMRALEAGRYLLRATNNGISAVIGPKGQLEVVGPQFEAAVVTGSIQPAAGSTPFIRWGNAPIVLLLMISYLFVALLAWRRAQQADAIS